MQKRVSPMMLFTLATLSTMISNKLCHLKYRLSDKSKTPKYIRGDFLQNYCSELSYWNYRDSLSNVVHTQLSVFLSHRIATIKEWWPIFISLKYLDFALVQICSRIWFNLLVRQLHWKMDAIIEQFTQPAIVYELNNNTWDYVKFHTH